MRETILTEAEVHERLGLRTLKPVMVGHGPKINLHRLNINDVVYLRRSDVLALLRAESHQLGGDPVLDKLATLITEVTS